MLLHRGSIVVEVCVIVLLVRHSTSQGYDYSTDEEYSPEYGAGADYGHEYYSAPVKEKKEGEGGNSVDYEGDPDAAEFEKFFLTPLEFDSPEESASSDQKKKVASKKPVNPDPFQHLRKAFFEKTAESASDPQRAEYYDNDEKKQQTEQSQIRPGPHYISHQIPVPVTFFKEDDGEQASSKDDVETIPPPLKKKGKAPKKYRVTDARPGFDGFKDSYDAFDLLRQTEEQIDQTKPKPRYYSGKDVDYNTGKSSSTVSQNYPSAAGYLAALKIPTTTVHPVEKYNLHPVTVDYEALQSKYREALAKVNKKPEPKSKPRDGQVQSTEDAPENCRKIHSPEHGEGMNCFVCEDAANKAKFTQCSYSESDDPVNNYSSSSMKYSVPSEDSGRYRYKRSPGRKGSYSDDPYFEISERSKKYYADFEKEQEAAGSERDKDFHYKPYGPDDYESYSESQSSELLKVPGACQKVEREGATCTVCRDEKTGGNFEQCSYTSAPKEHKYAYVAEKKYDSDDEPEESKTVTKENSGDDGEKEESGAEGEETSAGEYASATKSKAVVEDIPELEAAGTSVEETEAAPESEEDDEEEDDGEESDDGKKKKKEESGYDYPYYSYDTAKNSKNKQLVDDSPYNIPEHFAESIKSNSNQRPVEEEDDEESFDEYHYKLFPELHKTSESNNEEQHSEPSSKKQEVEEVLAEFAKKDRTNCKKAEKNGMTCFLCVDSNKVQHEECMYIAESKPKATHLAYHEVQRLKDPKRGSDEEEPEESKVQPQTEQPLDTVLPLASEKSKKKRFFKKVTTPLPLADLSGAGSELHKFIVPLDQPRHRFPRSSEPVASASAPDSERIESKKSNAEPEPPQEIDVGDEEGAYSHETKPVYSKLFDTTLPRYMVEKTEFEKDFDADAGF